MKTRLYLGVVVCITTMLGSDAIPVPQVYPGCRDHCAAYTSDGGDYNTCIGQCPTEAVCMEAIASTDTVEEYIDKVPGLPQRPRPCANHCWQSTVYAMHPCMLDCPATWCRLYSGITLPTTTKTTTTTTSTTTTTTPKPTTAKDSKTIEVPNVQAIVDDSAGGGSASNKHGSNAAIGLAVLVLCAVIIGAIVGIVIYRKRLQHRLILQQDQSQHNGTVLRTITEPTARQGGVQPATLGGFPATSGVVSDAHATPIVTSGSERLPQS